MLQPQIIFEDDSFYVINKPSGWITDSANTTKDQPVLQKWVSDNLQFQINDFEHRNGIVHRLDKETSGILLVAKTKEAFEDLQKQFKARDVNKTYTALVHGRVEKNGFVDASIGRLPWRRDRFGVLPDGREALTEYIKIADYKLENDDYTLLDLKPKTGRTHQIRVHLKHIGYPIVSDEFYAGRKTARHDRKWCKRLFLHAGGISFMHPKTLKRVEFKSETPDDLLEALAILTKLT